MGRTHVGFGVLFTSVGLPVVGNQVLHLDFSTAQMVAGCGIGAIAGVLPDIDHPDSLITHGIIPGGKKLGMIGKALGQVLSVPPRIVGAGVRQTMGHRGGTHSLLFGVGWAFLAAPIYAVFFGLIGMLAASIATTIAGFFPAVGNHSADISGWFGSVTSGTLHQLPLISAAVLLGYLAHLFSDGLTKVPVPLFWPFSKKRQFVMPLAPLRITTDSFTENYLIRPIVYLLAAAALGGLIVLPALQGFTSKHFNNQNTPPPAKAKTTPAGRAGVHH